MVSRNTTSPAFWLIVAALTTLTPLAIDISLPGLPAIARALDAPPALLQWTLSAFILTFGVGQLILGPLSDRYGRRPVLLGGLGLFVIAGVGCTLAVSAPVLIALRLVQGFGACAGTVCARAIAQDVSIDRAAGASRQAFLSAINTLAPMVAPILGVIVLATMSWRGLYGVLVIVGAMLFVLVAWRVPETSPRVAHEVSAAYARVVRLPRTAGLAIVGAASFFGYFAFITGSPFALVAQLHVSNAAFAVAFAINAAALLVGSTLTARFVRNGDPERFLLGGIAVLFGAGLLAWIGGTLAPSVPLFVTAMALYAFGCGVAGPVVFATVLAAARSDAGLASGLLGSTQMLAGALGSGIAGALPVTHVAAIGLVGTAGALLAAAGYAVSLPGLREQRKLRVRTADDRG